MPAPFTVTVRFEASVDSDDVHSVRTFKTEDAAYDWAVSNSPASCVWEICDSSGERVW